MTPKYSVQKSAVLTRTSLSPFDAFANDVLRSRILFFKELQKLPHPLNRIASRHFKNRMKLGSGRPFLGEYAPWLFADMFGITDKKSIEELTVPWLSLYAYIVFTDDLIDKTDIKEMPLLLIASGLLFERSLTGFFRMNQIRQHGQKLVENFNSHLTQAAEAVVAELRRHRRYVRRFADSEINALGSKIAMLKICAEAILVSQGISLDAYDLRLIDTLATGMQILDDLTDWEEDWRSGNYTFPLTEAFMYLQKEGICSATHPVRLPTDQVLIGMILSGSLEKALDKATLCLEKVIRGSRLNRGNATRHFLITLIQDNYSLRKKAVQLKELIRHQQNKGFRFAKITKDKVVQKELRTLRLYLMHSKGQS